MKKNRYFQRWHSWFVAAKDDFVEADPLPGGFRISNFWGFDFNVNTIPGLHAEKTWCDAPSRFELSVLVCKRFNMTHDMTLPEILDRLLEMCSMISYAQECSPAHLREPIWWLSLVERAWFGLGKTWTDEREWLGQYIYKLIVIIAIQAHSSNGIWWFPNSEISNSNVWYMIEYQMTAGPETACRTLEYAVMWGVIIPGQAKVLFQFYQFLI